MDYLGLPSVNQPYEIPIEFGERVNDYHDRAIFSIWAHFVAFCYKINHDKNSPDLWDQSCSYVDSPHSKVSMMSPSKIDLDYDDPTSMKNKYLRESKRLRIFVALSSSQYNNASPSHASCHADFISPYSYSCQRELFYQNYEEPFEFYNDMDDYCIENLKIDYNDFSTAEDDWNCYDVTA